MEKFEILQKLLKNDRSVRKFDELKRVSNNDLEKLIGLTTFCASGRNLQPLKYRLVYEEKECELFFPLMSWAGYLKDWDGPKIGERPAAYIVQCLDERLTKNCLCDDGLQLQAITLGATALGLGGCIIKSFNVEKVRELLGLPIWAQPIYVYALGYPKEKVILELTDGTLDADIRYFRTSDGSHHVPKRPLNEILI